MAILDTYRDERDGFVYKIAKMRDGRWWFAENFRFDSEESIGSSGVGVRSDDIRYDPNLFGRFYSLKAALQARPHCPLNWRLPDRKDWAKLVASYGGALHDEIPNSSRRYEGEPNICKALEGDGFSLVRGPFGHNGYEGNWGGDFRFAHFISATGPWDHSSGIRKIFGNNKPPHVWFISFSETAAFENPELMSFWFSVRYVRD